MFVQALVWPGATKSFAGAPGDLEGGSTAGAVLFWRRVVYSVQGSLSIRGVLAMRMVPTQAAVRPMGFQCAAPVGTGLTVVPAIAVG